jgi:Rieske Fe-S protein
MSAPQWREDFPITWEEDHYVTRRELAKFLTLGSVLLAAASAAIGLIGRLRRRSDAPGPIKIGTAAEIPIGGTLLFRYPTPEDPCIAIRAKDGKLRAYSQVCTHLSCAVVHRPQNDELFCPCHEGRFSASEGRPIAGPPTRRLPRILLSEERGDLLAVGKEV